MATAAKSLAGYVKNGFFAWSCCADDISTHEGSLCTNSLCHVRPSEVQLYCRRYSGDKKFKKYVQEYAGDDSKFSECASLLPIL